MTRVMVGDALVFENERLLARMNQFFDRVESQLRQSLRDAAVAAGSTRRRSTPTCRRRCSPRSASAGCSAARSGFKRRRPSSSTARSACCSVERVGDGHGAPAPDGCRGDPPPVRRPLSRGGRSEGRGRRPGAVAARAEGRLVACRRRLARRRPARRQGGDLPHARRAGAAERPAPRWRRSTRCSRAGPRSGSSSPATSCTRPGASRAGDARCPRWRARHAGWRDAGARQPRRARRRSAADAGDRSSKSLALARPGAVPPPAGGGRRVRARRPPASVRLARRPGARPASAAVLSLRAAGRRAATFGSFTRMHAIRRQPGDRVYVVADQTVTALPAGRGGSLIPSYTRSHVRNTLARSPDRARRGAARPTGGGAAAPLIAPDWTAATAFRYRKRGGSGVVEPVRHVASIRLDAPWRSSRRRNACCATPRSSWPGRARTTFC